MLKRCRANYAACRITPQAVSPPGAAGRATLRSANHKLVRLLGEGVK